MMPGNKVYTIQYLDVVVSEDIPSLPKTIRNSIQHAIEERLMVDPIGFDRPLRYSLKGHRRLRVGDYRVIYTVHSTQRKVIVLAIKHRKNVCEV